MRSDDPAAVPVNDGELEALLDDSDFDSPEVKAFLIDTSPRRGHGVESFTGSFAEPPPMPNLVATSDVAVYQAMPHVSLQGMVTDPENIDKGGHFMTQHFGLQHDSRTIVSFCGGDQKMLDCGFSTALVRMSNARFNVTSMGLFYTHARGEMSAMMDRLSTMYTENFANLDPKGIPERYDPSRLIVLPDDESEGCVKEIRRKIPTDIFDRWEPLPCVNYPKKMYECAYSVHTHWRKVKAAQKTITPCYGLIGALLGAREKAYTLLGNAMAIRAQRRGLKAEADDVETLMGDAQSLLSSY